MRKNSPIPIRFDDEDTRCLELLSQATGISVSELIRVCVRLALEDAKQTGKLRIQLGTLTREITVPSAALDQESRQALILEQLEQLLAEGTPKAKSTLRRLIQKHLPASPL